MTEERVLQGEAAAWLKDKGLQTVFDALEAAGGEARIAGGAVRNTLMDKPVSDIDLCTTLLPEQTVKALESAGIKAVPTGFEHGTVTAVADGQGYEITTLREDVETDGRHAVVKFGTDWKRDAERRDLTMNALYCDRTGRVFDPLEGMADLEAGLVRFIGEAEARIEEDFLRILRFFRFYAEYGSGRPDAAGLKACNRLKAGLEQISAERIWAELRKLLGAMDPSRALLWMRTTGVSQEVLPESAKWGIDLIPALLRTEKAIDLKPDALRRMMAIVPPDGGRISGLAKRLRLSKAEEQRMLDWAMEDPVDAKIDQQALKVRLYRGKLRGVVDRMILQLANADEKGDAETIKQLKNTIDFSTRWERPVFPVKGKDLMAQGHTTGKEMGSLLAGLEKQWIDSDFTLSKAELIALADKTA